MLANPCLRLAALSCVLLCANAASFNNTTPGSFLRHTQQLQCVHGRAAQCAGGMSSNNNCCSGCCSDDGPHTIPRRACVPRSQCKDICVKPGGGCANNDDCCARFQGNPKGCDQRPANYTKCSGYSIAFPCKKI